MTRLAVTPATSKWSRAAREARRLTAEERGFRDLREKPFQLQVTDLAELLGWTWCHWRPLRNGRGIWQVPVEGPLGKGWPDLTLVRPRDRRLIFAELKREMEDPGPDQVAVLETLSALDGRWMRWAPAPTEAMRLGVHLWRPSDLAGEVMDSTIGRILR